MNQTSNPIIKRGRGRPRKIQVSPITELELFIKETPQVSMVIEPTNDDLADELSRMDSFSYGKYNN